MVNKTLQTGLQFNFPHMLCELLLCMCDGIYCLKSSSNDRFLRSFSRQFYLLSEFLAKSVERKSPKIYFSYFIIIIFFLMTDVGYEPRLLTIISRHTTYYTTTTSINGLTIFTQLQKNGIVNPETICV